MSTRLLILVSMILHLVTFIALALGSIYELKWLTVGALVTLVLGLFFGKTTLERLDEEENPTESADIDEDPPLGIG